MSTYDDELRKHLATKGMLVDAEGRLAADPTYQGTPPSAEHLHYFNAVAERRQHDINAELRRQWVAALVDVTSVLVKDGTKAPWPYYSVFWIRLHGLFADVAPYWEQAFRFLELDRKTYQAAKGSPLHIGQFILGTIDMVRGLLTEDEMIYLDYRRHSESHPIQSAFDLQLQHGKIRDKRRIEILDNKGFTVAEMDAACKRVLTASNINERDIAVAYATKIESILPSVLDGLDISIGRTVTRRHPKR